MVLFNYRAIYPAKAYTVTHIKYISCTLVKEIGLMVSMCCKESAGQWGAFVERSIIVEVRSGIVERKCGRDEAVGRR
jgi:hypothetical protein